MVDHEKGESDVEVVLGAVVETLPPDAVFVTVDGVVESMLLVSAVEIPQGLRRIVAIAGGSFGGVSLRPNISSALTASALSEHESLDDLGDVVDFFTPLLFSVRCSLPPGDDDVVVSALPIFDSGTYPLIVLLLLLCLSNVKKNEGAVIWECRVTNIEMTRHNESATKTGAEHKFTMAAVVPAVRTKITQLLQCRYPILLPGMSWISTPELVAAVSNSGTLLISGLNAFAFTL